MEASKISLDDLLDLAKRESAKLQHFYIGVEHLFLALTRLQGGVTAYVFEKHGGSQDYLRYITRAQSDQRDDEQKYLGIRTPRAQKVVSVAQNMLRDGDEHSAERALLLAIIDERESLTLRYILKNLRIGWRDLRHAVVTWSQEHSVELTLPPPTVESTVHDFTLDAEEMRVLQTMFRTESRVIIERALSSEAGSYSGAKVLLVRAFEADGREQAPSVVKLHDRHAILWEKLRYNDYVRDKLPAFAARIVVDTLPENSTVGGLKYTFVQGGVDARSTNLKLFAENTPHDQTAQFLRAKLYDGFRATWWGQRKPYPFIAWQEYELLLPPALILKYMPDTALSPTTRVIKPLDETIREESEIRHGEILALTEFCVLKVKGDKVQFVAGAEPGAVNMSCRVDVSSFPLAKFPNLHRGLQLPRVVGQVIDTRDGILQAQVHEIAPDFDFTANPLPYYPGLPYRLPNPLREYRFLLNQRIQGTFCSMHGDLHTGNILIGRDREAWLIDFEWARDGHTLFDWAVLEISYLIDLIAPQLEDTWSSAWEVIGALDALARGQVVAPVFLPIMEIRHIVKELLADGRNWAEYYTALGLVALRVLGWRNRSLTARRIAYLVAGQAIELTLRERKHQLNSSTETDDDNVPATKSSLTGGAPKLEDSA